LKRCGGRITPFSAAIAASTTGFQRFADMRLLDVNASDLP
jgi:hypothetical protein